MNPVYITRLASFLPNEPVENDQIEQVLGLVNNKPSRARSLVLRNNGIKKRYYALRDGVRTHTNTQMAALAIQSLFQDGKDISKMQLLASGTSSPEQVLPSLAAMVHGELGIHRIELISTTGACCASVQALKYAYMSVGSGLTDMAVATGSERFSAHLTADRFRPEAETWKDIETNPFLAFEKDFLRWMLSDGAGAALLEKEPNATGLSLKIEWIEITSFANELETCMYAGAVKNEDGTLTGFNDLSARNWNDDSVFAYKQDTRLLGENIIKKGGEFLVEVMKKHSVTSDKIDWFLPHMSSEFFKAQIEQHDAIIELAIPKEKWFYNLTRVGNVGSASPLLMLDELIRTGNIKTGDRILVMVPESARFTYAYIYLTVV